MGKILDDNAVAILCLCVLCGGIVFFRIDPLYATVNTITGGILGYIAKGTKMA